MWKMRYREWLRPNLRQFAHSQQRTFLSTYPLPVHSTFLPSFSVRVLLIIIVVHHHFLFDAGIVVSMAWAVGIGTRPSGVAKGGLRG
jgi:hypothetical protein